jgi:hypothetical protein
MKNCEKLNRLPKDVQNEVINTLKAWEGCYVNLYDDGHYEVSVCISLVKGTLPYNTIESFKNSEIFTPEESKKYAEEAWKNVDMSDY